MDKNDPLSAGSLNSLAEDAFKKSADAMKNAEIGKTVKFMGLFEVDAGIAGSLSAIYNIASNWLTNVLQPKAYDLTKKYASRMGVEGQALNMTAAVAATTVTVATKAGGYLGPLFQAHSTQRKERIELARSLAPVLDDIKGRHSVGTLYNVKANENEVIFAQRKRIGSIAHSRNFKAVVDLAVNSGANLTTDVGAMAKILSYKGEVSKNYNDIVNKDAQNDLKESKMNVTDVNNKHEQKNLLGGIISVAAGQIADRIAKTNEKKLRDTLPPYSAYEMIRELEEQVVNNPKASSFQEPKAFGNKNGYAKSYPLEEYVMRIFIQHQKDMSAISPEHTEIREALKEDLTAVAKPIAEAIRKGDMSALSLVRLVGEGKVIKNQGRALARPEDIEELIERDVPKQVNFMRVDPKDYFGKTVSFTKDEAKTAWKAMDAEERLHFGAMQPLSALEALGMTTAEAKKVHEDIAKDYDRMLADAIIGINEKSDDDLSKDGLAKSEIKALRKAFEKIEHDGLDAIHDLRVSPTNDHGIEHLISDIEVSQVITGDKTYLGKAIHAGHTKFDDVASERKKDEGRGARHADRMRPSIGHEDKESHHKGHFADRESHRAAENHHSYAERE